MRLIGRRSDDYDYSLYFNDLQNRGVSEEVSVAEVVALFSALTGKSVMNSLIICGRVVMSGTMMPLTTELDEILVASINAGAKTILLPADSEEKYKSLSIDIKSGIAPLFYSTPVEAVRIALNIMPDVPIMPAEEKVISTSSEIEDTTKDSSFDFVEDKPKNNSFEEVNPIPKPVQSTLPEQDSGDGTQSNPKIEKADDDSEVLGHSHPRHK